MTACLLGQLHIELTNPFGTSAGMDFPAADLACIYPHPRMASGNQLAALGMPCSRLQQQHAHLHCMHVVAGNFKSP
jgi:hypothetical protein